MRSWLRYVLVGLAVRLLLAPFFMHAWDMGTVFEASRQFLGGLDPYSHVAEMTRLLRDSTGLPLYYHGFAYLPQTLLFFAPSYWLYSLLFPGGGGLDLRAAEFFEGLATLPSPQIFVFLLLIKLPVILGDAAVIYLLSRREPRLGLFYALNPYVLFITAVWGNFDPLVGLFLLASYLSFGDRRVLSGFLYGLSLMKLYTVVLLPLLLVRTSKWRELAKFVAGLSIASIPVVCYLLLAPEGFLEAIFFQGARPVYGMNVYQAVSSERGVLFQTGITRFATLTLLVAVLSLTFVALKEGLSTLDSVVVLLLAFMLFAPVTNEQHLAALMPLALLSERFDRRLWVFPLLFAAFHATYVYFAAPVFWTDVALRAAYEAIHGWWITATGSFSSYARYFVSLSFAFLAFRNIHSHIKPRIPAAPKVKLEIRLPGL